MRSCAGWGAGLGVGGQGAGAGDGERAVAGGGAQLPDAGRAAGRWGAAAAQCTELACDCAPRAASAPPGSSGAGSGRLRPVKHGKRGDRQLVQQSGGRCGGHCAGPAHGAAGRCLRVRLRGGAIRGGGGVAQLVASLSARLQADETAIATLTGDVTQLRAEDSLLRGRLDRRRRRTAAAAARRGR